MSALGWTLLGLSLAGCVWGARRWAWLVVNDLNYGNMSRIDGEELFAGFFIGLLLCWTWPALVVYGVLRRVHGLERGERILWALVFSEPRHRRRERELAAREERVRSLEREVGIR